MVGINQHVKVVFATPPVEGCTSHDSEASLWNSKFEFAVTAIEG
jgi:hypothetical protein